MAAPALPNELEEEVLLRFPPPSLLREGKVALMASSKNGDGLGIANVEGYNLHVWSWSAAAGGGGGSNGGTQQWVKDQVIKLDTVVLPIATGDPASAEFDVVGFGEGIDIIFVSTNDGIFVVWRKSGRVMKVGERRPVVLAEYIKLMYCYKSFYTPALGAILEGEGPEASSVSSA